MEQVEGNIVSRSDGRGTLRGGTPSVQPLCEPLEREPGLFLHDQFAVEDDGAVQPADGIGDLRKGRGRLTAPA